MANESMFGGAESPLRNSPQFRKCMEEYKLLEGKVEELQSNRGNLSYEEVTELTTLKKLKLATRDEMEEIKRVCVCV